MSGLKEELAQVEAGIEALERRKQEIYKASLDAPAEEKVCEDWIAEMLADGPLTQTIKYPIEVTGIAVSASAPYMPDGLTSGKVGSWVSVRPVGEAYENKTYLGVLLGRLAQGVGARHHTATGVLELYAGHHNPAIWVPDLKKVIFGSGSFWGVIKGPDDLRKITDADIENVWYIKALRELGG